MVLNNKLTYSHPRKYGPGSRKCRVCSSHHGVIRKYNLHMCRRCFREYAADIGFKKLIVLLGLDVRNNLAHKNIWEALIMNRRPDRPPLNFQLVSGDSHDLTTMRTKEPSQEAAVKGILKVDWMAKHLHRVPAVLVLFVDLDWNSPFWNEKLSECASKIQSIRHSFYGRNPYLALVLVQSFVTLPTDELATQKAAELCSSCELSSKLLFILPQSEHLFGYVVRLEFAFYDLAQNYYQNELKLLKSKKEALSRTVSQRLYVRYSFKQGFFSELRQDAHSALKYYKQAYQMLLEIEPVDTAVTELKVIGGYLTYKICRLYFKHNAASESMSHFQKHIEYFRNKTSKLEAEFEHFAWLSKQYSFFAELFDAAVQSGLTTSSAEHPGFYYQTAADYMIRRQREFELSFKEEKNEPRTVEETEEQISTTATAVVGYCGQRTDWSLSSTIDSEGRFDHSSAAVGLLCNAMAHFKNYPRSVRSRHCLLVRLGMQYVRQGRLEQALQAFLQALGPLRRARWTSLVSACLAPALRCAYALARPKEYVALVLELLNVEYGVAEPARRVQLQRNLLALSSGTVPEPEEEADKEESTTAQMAWQRLLLDSTTTFVPVAAGDINAGLTVTGGFCSPEGMAVVAASTTFQLRLKSDLPQPLQLTKVSVQFVAGNDPTRSWTLDTPIEQQPLLQPSTTHLFEFHICPRPEHAGGEIQATSITLHIGQLTSKVYITLVWDVQSISSVGFCISNLGRKAAKLPVELPKRIKVLPKPPKLAIVCDDGFAVLIGEKYLYRVTVENLESAPISKLKLKVFESANSRCQHGIKFGYNIEQCDGAALSLELDSLMPNCKASSVFYITMEKTVDNVSMHLQITYEVMLSAENTDMSCNCTLDRTVSFSSIMPFVVESYLCTMMGQRVNELVVKEDVLLWMHVRGVSVPTLICSCTLHLCDKVHMNNPINYQTFEDAVIDSDTSLSEICSLRPVSATTEPISIAHATFCWKRWNETSSSEMISTSFSLCNVNIVSCPVIVSCVVPSFGVMYRPFLVKYSIENTTEKTVQLEATFESSERFMFSGMRKDLLKLTRLSKLEIILNVLPLIDGFSTLPRLQLLSSSEAVTSSLKQYSQRNVPLTILITPKDSTVSSSQDSKIALQDAES
ncbi:Trafficking protein particle complex subunit 11 [Trichinella zimbabwensis]|uniref:Small ribosomal subunit protein uS14 n=1 Tax=Trichinella zimbabwensis TaxID=268475 RepID=A0A0V1I8W4_9BILA|nr:Trafficking protein particle complex subunit 11 [Trichinella zimbabwensis]